MERGARADQIRRADSRPKESVHRQRRVAELLMIAGVGHAGEDLYDAPED